MNSAGNVTELLNRWVDGDAAAREQVAPIVYDELKRIARGVFAGERQGHTLQPTALVHEAYAKLIDVDITWQDRAHFYALAARMMRRLLVNYATARATAKRGGGALHITLHDDAHAAREPGENVLALDSALAELSAMDERKGQILEMHYFGGLTQREIGVAIDLSESTVRRELRVAKLWMRKSLAE